MRIIIQRVKQASVKVDSQIIGSIEKGILVFLGIHKNDSTEQSTYRAKKILNLRLFPDEEGKMNRSLEEVKGNVLVVSQFTLYGNCLNGRRPDFIDAAPPNIAEPIYKNFIQHLEKEGGKKVEQGQFGAYMEISLINDGPVTFLLEK